MAPTSASLKTHTGHGSKRDGSSNRGAANNAGGGVGDSEDNAHFEHHLNGRGRHPSSSDPRHRHPRRPYHHHHRRLDNLRIDDDGGHPAGQLTTPTPVRESSEVSSNKCAKSIFFQYVYRIE